MNKRILSIGGFILICALVAFGAFLIKHQPTTETTVNETEAQEQEQAEETSVLPEAESPIEAPDATPALPPENAESLVSDSPSGLYRATITNGETFDTQCAYMHGGCILRVKNIKTGEVYLESKVEELPALGSYSFNRSSAPAIQWTEDDRLIFAWGWGDAGYISVHYTEFDIETKTHAYLAGLLYGEGCTNARMDVDEPFVLIIKTTAEYRCGYQGTESSGAVGGYDVYAAGASGVSYTYLYTAKNKAELIDKYLKPSQVIKELFSEKLTEMLSIEI